MANAPTYFVDDTAVSARSAEVPGANFADGCNAAGSCSEGIGIGTDVTGLDEAEQWTLLDQDGDPRTPQVGQYIGGTGLSGTYPSSGGTDGKGTVGIDVADTAALDGTGTVSSAGEATLADLAAGWTAV